MRTYTDTTATSKKHRIRDSLRHLWQDTATADRAPFRSYDDYLLNRRDQY